MTLCLTFTGKTEVQKECNRNSHGRGCLGLSEQNKLFESKKKNESFLIEC